MLLREVPVVRDRVLTTSSHTIHRITRSDTKELEIRVREESRAESLMIAPRHSSSSLGARWMRIVVSEGCDGEALPDG